MNPEEVGIQLCSRYAFAPNYFHFCGPEKQADLFAYVNEHAVDSGLSEMLSHFDTLYAYLVLIASSNSIKDPFDVRVVEAYWLGNSLVTKVPLSSMKKHLEDGLQLKKKISNKKLLMLPEILPTHNDHVFSIFMRTGHHAIAHTLQTMDSCRISWGKVKEKTPSDVIVETQPLVYIQDSLSLGAIENKRVVCVGIQPEIGDWVSMHWGYVCEVLSRAKLRNLIQYTRRSLQGTALSL